MTIVDTIVPVAFSLQHNKIHDLTYEQIYNKLIKKYNEENEEGCTMYEYFSTKSSRTNIDSMFKPYIDYEEHLSFDYYSKDDFKESSYITKRKNQMVDILCELFNIKQEDIAISSDCRKLKNNKVKKEKNEKYFKISFHFILCTKKVYIENFLLFLEENKDIFENEGVNPKYIDMSVYKGDNKKFRIPMTKKNANEKLSLLKPLNYKSKEDFHKHLVTITEGCEELDLKINNYHKSNLNKVVREKIEHMVQFDNDIDKNIQSVLNRYTKLGSSKEESGCELYDIKEHLCGINHNNNHNYIIHNKVLQNVKVKCHSERCVEFEKIIYQRPPPTIDFDPEYFNAIPITQGCENNYLECKQYFEEFFKFIRDQNAYIRIQKKYDKRRKYYNKSNVSVQIQGFSDLCYKQKKKDTKGDIEYKKFLEKYKNDVHKKSYMNLTFSPVSPSNTDEGKSKNYFNLFPGFNYENVINEEQKNNIPEQKKNELKFLLKHIKNYVCQGIEAKKNKEKEMTNNLFNYLMSYFANIIQQPQQVPQVILIFFSSAHGTGKSNLTKFLANVVGYDLTFFGDFQHILSSHSNAHVGKLINVVEEVDKYTTLKYRNEIKDFSQRTNAPYNEKNKQMINIDTFVRYIFTTNDNDGVYYDEEDRRYVLFNFIKVLDEHNIKYIQENGKTEYIKYIEKIMNDPYIIYLFGKMLEKWDIPYKSVTEWSNSRPLSKNYTEMRKRHPIDQFLNDLITLETVDITFLSKQDFFLSEDNKTIINISKVAFYDLYKSYNNESLTTHKTIGKTNFYKFLGTKYRNIIQQYKIRNKQYISIRIVPIWQSFYPPTEKFNNVFITKKE